MISQVGNNISGGLSDYLLACLPEVDGESDME